MFISILPASKWFGGHYRRCVAIMTCSLAIAWGAWAYGQSVTGREAQDQSFSVPSYNLLFEERDPVPGIGAMPAIRLPYGCTEDGTVLVTMVQPLGTGSRPSNLSSFSPSTVVVSISRSGEAHSFLLDKVPDLVDITDVDHFAFDSHLIFLIRGARDDSGKSKALNDGATPKAEHHLFIVTFDRSGNYEETDQIDDARFLPYQLGAFPSGNFLAFGYDKVDHAPKLALLKDDGTILKYLAIPKDDSPKSALGTLSGDGAGPALYLGQVQFVAQKQNIFVSQNKTDFPLLEVNESGAIREIRPKLARGTQIKMLIPSDENLYIVTKDSSDGWVYELNSQTGAVLQRLRSTQTKSQNIACVNGKEFLSFKDMNGKLLPLVGKVETAR